MSEDDLEGFLLGLSQAEKFTEVKMPLSVSAPSVREFVEMTDKMLAAAGLHGHALVATLADIERECGAEYVEAFGQDLHNLIAGRRDGFSFTSAGRAYTPEEVQSLCGELGLTEFRWAGDGGVVGATGVDTPARRMFEPEYGGQLGVWEFMVRKPV